MNLKRLAFFGVFLWVLIFIETTIFAINHSTGRYFIETSLILTVFFSILISWLYFRDVKASLKEGFILGVSCFIIGVVLNFILQLVAVSILFRVGFENVNFYTRLFDPEGFIILVEAIIVTSIYGYGTTKKQIPAKFSRKL